MANYLKCDSHCKHEGYTKEEVYAKAETYAKTETYAKDEVYSKDEVYTKGEVYPKDEVYSKNDFVVMTGTLTIPIGGTQDDKAIGYPTGFTKDNTVVVMSAGYILGAWRPESVLEGGKIISTTLWDAFIRITATYGDGNQEYVIPYKVLLMKIS